MFLRKKAAYELPEERLQRHIGEGQKEMALIERKETGGVKNSLGWCKAFVFDNCLFVRRGDGRLIRSTPIKRMHLEDGCVVIRTESGSVYRMYAYDEAAC